MSLFWGNFKNEYLKLLSRKKYIVFLIIEVVICICAFLIQGAANKIMDGSAVGTVLKINKMAMGMLTFFIQIYIPLIGFMACSDLFASEIGDNSIKAVLLRPISRFKVFFSKAAAVFAFCAQYLVALLLITTILEAISNGSVNGFFSSFGAYLLDLIPLAVVMLMAVLLNQFTKSSSLTMFLCIIIYAVLYILGIIYPTVAGFSFTSYMQWHKIWLGSTIPFSAMLSKIGILAGYGLLFSCGGFFLFDRRDY